MLHRLLSTIIFAVACIAGNAQGICTINGNIADVQLKDGKKIKKVYLTRTNGQGDKIEVAAAAVKKGKYCFKYELAQDEPALLYTITGFGEDTGIELFVEAGDVTVTTASAADPKESEVSGTPTNDTYSAYKSILKNGRKEVADKVAALVKVNGKEWLESAEGKDAIKRIEAHEGIKTESQVIRFFIEHNASAMTPLEIERSLLPKLTAAYAEQMTKSISVTLQDHPYYHQLRNKMLANDMKEGNEVPDITLPLLNGETKKLTDYRGKYVVLNFWANDCNKSTELLDELNNLCDVIKNDTNQYVIISYALESDGAVWKERINSNGFNREGWLHASDGAGKESATAKLFGVEKTPKVILVEPEGRAVSLNMDIDEIIIRIEQIMSGDLYYLDKE